VSSSNGNISDLTEATSVRKEDGVCIAWFPR
jgi:hypothetical protein